MDATHINPRRRRFLQAGAAMGLGMGLASPGALRAITPMRSEDMKLGPDAVQLRPEIEPVVRWIEETPRDRILETAVGHLKGGLSYRDLLAGLFLAGIRNIKPRPVGFKFHAVLVVNSAHVLGQTAPVDDRLLPLLWALDNFKSSQAQDVKEGDWTLNKVDEARVPSPGRARAEFAEAMDAWDADKADAAVSGLCRAAGAAEVMQAFWHYAVRDQRNIGHKAIFAMQCWRTLQTVGWANAEPVLRSLAFGMLDLQGDKPGTVGPYEANVELARTVRPEWMAGKADPAATRALLEVMRQADPEAASAEAATMLNNGVAPGSIWDAVSLAGAELLMRKPGILPIHAVTSANALHYIHEASGDDTTRKLALLQAVGWMPMFRDRTAADGGVRIDALEAVPTEAKGKDEAITEVFATINKDRSRASGKALAYLNDGGSPDLLFATARRLIFHKGRDSHDYKYGAAAWEEFELAADPRWQAPLAAATMANLPGAETPDSPLMRRAREAVAQVL